VNPRRRAGVARGAPVMRRHHQGGRCWPGPDEALARSQWFGLRVTRNDRLRQAALLARGLFQDPGRAEEVRAVDAGLGALDNRDAFADIAALRGCVFVGRCSADILGPDQIVLGWGGFNQPCAGRCALSALAPSPVHLNRFSSVC